MGINLLKEGLTIFCIKEIILGSVWDCSAFVFLAPLHLCVTKHLQVQKFRSKKKIELEVNSIFFLEHLKMCTSVFSFVLPRGAREKLPTLSHSLMKRSIRFLPPSRTRPVVLPPVCTPAPYADFFSHRSRPHKRSCRPATPNASCPPPLSCSGRRYPCLWNRPGHAPSSSWCLDLLQIRWQAPPEAMRARSILAILAGVCRQHVRRNPHVARARGSNVLGLLV